MLIIPFTYCLYNTAKYTYYNVQGDTLIIQKTSGITYRIQIHVVIFIMIEHYEMPRESRVPPSGTG